VPDITGNGRICIVVMGPSGVGKTTIAQMIATRLGWDFAEADEFHPKANIDKMSKGIPLDDDDRWPWLRLLRDWITGEKGKGRDAVVTCSALKRSYRDVLREAGCSVRFLELSADPTLVEDRMSRRTGHYMPTSLLASQFQTLEPLGEDENGVRVSVELTPEEIVQAAIDALDLPGKAQKTSAAQN
jgi:gluconokinase